MLSKLLTSFVLWVYNIYFNFFKKKDYRIIYKSLEYELDVDGVDYEFNKEWDDEIQSWDMQDDIETYYIDNVSDSLLCNIPRCVSISVLRIKYWYDNKIYKVATYDPEFYFKSNDIISFTLPIKEAWLLDYDDTPVIDVSKKIKRYAGPKNNFHNEVVKVKHIFDYTDEYILENYPKIKVVDILGKFKCSELLFVKTTTLLP